MTRRWRSGRSVLLPLFFPFLCQSQLEGIVRTWENDPALKHATISYCIADAGTGEMLSSYHAEQLVVPASTLKLFTTAAATGMLGADFRFVTRIGHTGQRNGGIVTGDLLITGSGDPTLSSSRYKDENFPSRLCAMLRAKGITAVKGDVVGDASMFRRVVPDHWIWADISNYFGAVPSALNYRDNKFTIILKSGAPGSTVSVKETPALYAERKFTLSCEATAGGKTDEAYVYGDPFGYERVIRGTIPPHQAHYEIEAALPDPALLCAEEAAGAMRASGITVKGGTSDYSGGNEKVFQIGEFSSPPLSSIVQFTNRFSDNLYCESLVLRLGNGDAKKGLQEVRKYWKMKGLDSDLLLMADGCGLSRANLVTAGLMTRMLCAAAMDKKLFDVLLPSLPVAGEPGGMSSIGRGTAIAGKMHAKTGYIEHVRAYAGYLKTKSGRLVAFSLFFNNYVCSPPEARTRMEKLLVAMADLK